MKTINLLMVLLASLVSTTTSAEYLLPDYQRFTLKNGLTVYLMEQKEVPLVDISVVVKVGAIEDKVNAGLSYMTAQNLVLGTQKLTKSALDLQIDFVGANISSASNKEFSTIRSSFASKDTLMLMTMMRDIVIAPRFDQQEFTKFKKRHLLNLEQDKESARAVINQYFNQAIFGNKGYGAMVDGNTDTVNDLTLEHIKQHYHHWYQPKNTAIIVAGDFDQKVMKQQINALFIDWKNHSTTVNTVITAVKANKKPKVLLVNKSDAAESTFIIGGKGISRNNPDRIGLMVINTILGGRFTSWLNDELRINTGLTYGARSGFNSYSNDGTFTISTFTQTDTTIEAIDLALQTYARLWQKGIDQQSLNSAKSYVKGQFPPEFETSSQLASLLEDMYGYGFDQSYINTFQQQVDSLTVEGVNTLINKYFPKENLQFVIIGNAAVIKKKVEKYGDVTVVDILDVNLTTH
jgi:predicted Zn-dependent peptidase